MLKKLTMIILAGVVFGSIFSSNIVAETFEKLTPTKLPLDQIAPSSPTPLTGDKGFCLIQSDDDNTAFYYGGFRSGDGLALYMDPATCGQQNPYPFKITDVHFYLYDPGGGQYTWPVEIIVNIRDIAGGIKCNGPGNVLCSQIYTIPSDSAWPDTIHLYLDVFCCVYSPFFLEIGYTGGTDTLYPSLTMTAQQVDTCAAWFHWGQDGIFYEWSNTWSPPPPGYPVLRITGYTQSGECDSCWYWKPDRPSQTHPAPSGMPDFDQHQFPTPDSQSLCGPTAVANCLWWFDAVPERVSPDSLIRLLCTYFSTDPESGTYVDSIKSGLNRYFQESTFDFYAERFSLPEFVAMEESLKKSQDIILLLGFWQYDEPHQMWFRFGGHFVTMAGVCSESLQVALSDPFRDLAEIGGPGRIRPPVHPSHPGNYTLHNDPKYVSHDIFQATSPSPSPGGLWSLPWYFDKYISFEGQNFQPEQWSYYQPYMQGVLIYAEVEYAIMICPKTSAVEEEQEGAITPKDFQLYQSYPNPFNNQTVIKYDLLKSCQVSLSIYNLLGQKVKTLVNQRQEAGPKIISWDGKDEKGKDLATGIYFYQLKVGEVTLTKRMVLLK